MPGRPLRRQRQQLALHRQHLQAIDQLSDTDAADLAYAVATGATREDLATLVLATLPRPQASALCRNGFAGAERFAAAHAIASDPAAARRAIGIHADLPWVTDALARACEKPTDGTCAART